MKNERIDCPFHFYKMQAPLISPALAGAHVTIASGGQPKP